MGEPTARHAAIREKLRWLDPNPNLPEHLRRVSTRFYDLALELLDDITEDDPQLTLALQHLIDAKDCAVRARLAQDDPPDEPVRRDRVHPAAPA